MFRPSYLHRNGLNTSWEMPGGEHPGVCNVVLCDGSVRGVQVNVEYALWLMINGRSDGIPLGDF